jgi:predicted ATPase
MLGDDGTRYGERVSIPQAVRSTVLRRIERMSSFERAVLMRASVIGHRFELFVLIAAAAGTEGEVRAALHHACDLGLIAVDESIDGRYSFAHALTREIVYAELLALHVRPIHRRIARALEASPRGLLWLEKVAYHSWAAHDRRRSLKYNELAGDSAAAIHALDDARTFYDRARSVVDGGSRADKRLERKLSALAARNESVRLGIQ